MSHNSGTARIDPGAPSASPATVGCASHEPVVALLKFVGAALVVVLVSGASVAAITAWRLNSGRCRTMAPCVLIGETEGPPPKIGAIEGGFNILIVGTDTREGQGGVGGTDRGRRGRAQRRQHPAARLAGPDQRGRGELPPRPGRRNPGVRGLEDGDTKGYSTEPINTALYYGGLACVVQTVSALTGLPIQFAGMISFVGVVDMSQRDRWRAGLRQRPSRRRRDRVSTFRRPARTSSPGFDALAFLRSRAGVGDGSDLTRISSQQVYLSALVRKLKSDDDARRPRQGVLPGQRGGATASRSRRASRTSTPWSSIALALKNIPLERVTFVQYPGTTGGDGIYSGKVQPRRGRSGAVVRAHRRRHSRSS